MIRTYEMKIREKCCSGEGKGNDLPYKAEREREQCCQDGRRNAVTNGGRSIDAEEETPSFVPSSVKKNLKERALIYSKRFGSVQSSKREWLSPHALVFSPHSRRRALAPAPPRPRPTAAQIAHPPSPLSPNPLSLSLSLPPTHRRLRRGPTLPLFSVPGNGGASETLDEAPSSSPSAEKENEEEEEEEEERPIASSASSDPDAGSAVAEELKEMMRARRKEASPSPSPSPSSDLWGGVLEEIREIEWPAFGKVVGTTGVVLAVIAGSTVALLTVNAVLAELSDRVFAGKGLQDFFG
ncbi:Preprotein translocase subunit SECE1 [Ananas comosus]|uniref:Preprotein translocase subunit SECE1 n=1 Tax=Ananas comosus TaxID=4615 RepID=A0A199UHT6_ANACO|nr:Preprotein translocase subunit SECE1 [Ananas comosus]